MSNTSVSAATMPWSATTANNPPGGKSFHDRLHQTVDLTNCIRQAVEPGP